MSNIDETSIPIIFEEDGSIFIGWQKKAILDNFGVIYSPISSTIISPLKETFVDNSLVIPNNFQIITNNSAKRYEIRPWDYWMLSTKERDKFKNGKISNYSNCIYLEIYANFYKTDIVEINYGGCDYFIQCREVFPTNAQWDFYWSGSPKINSVSNPAETCWEGSTFQLKMKEHKISGILKRSVLLSIGPR